MWVELPLDKGAVNSRAANQLGPGEFAEASGVRYKPGDRQLHNDIPWTPWPFDPSASLTYGWRGPFYLSFEGKNDWIMLVANQGDGATTNGRIYFARADGQTDWQSSSYLLNDNVGNQTGLTAASLAHWGDRYYLATDQGCAEIAPPTGTGTPTVIRLGLPAPEPRLDFIGNSSIVVDDTGSWTTNTDTTNCDIVPDDVFFFVLTEYDSDTGWESAPVIMSKTTGSGWWGSTADFPYAQASANGEYPVITFPTDFYGSGDTWRVYFYYLGNVNSTISYNEINNICRAIWQDGSPPTGTNILSKNGQTEFEAGTTVGFSTIKKSLVTNSLPVLAVDGARLIYNAFRHPSASTAAAVWNDSLVLNDAGFDRDTESSDFDVYTNIIGVPQPNEQFGLRGQEAIPTILRYSPPGEPWNQPVPYFLNFASEREDAVKGLIVVNDRLLVLCDQAAHTVRYLPFNNLLASQQGRVKDVLTTNVGLASQRAVAKVETSRGEMAVWLSHRGLEWTDGTMWDDACRDFKIPAGVDPSAAVLVNMSAEYRLDLYLGTNLYSFYYHPDHIKDGRLKMLGPTDLGYTVLGACEYKGTAYRFDGTKLYWTNTDQSGGTGYVYTGHTQGDNPFKDLVAEDLALTHDGSGATITLRADAAVTGNALNTGNEVTLQNTDLLETSSAGVGQRGNYIRFRFEATGSADWAIGPAWLNVDQESGGLG